MYCKWWYWYWGANLSIAILGYVSTLVMHMYLNYQLGMPLITTATLYSIANTLVPATAKLLDAKCDITASDYKSKALEAANLLYTSPDNTRFNEAFYIKGKFSPAYRYFKKLTTIPLYHLLLNNCMQTTIDGLRKGTFTVSNSKNKKRLIAARSMIIPNLAFLYLNSFFKEK